MSRCMLSNDVQDVPDLDKRRFCEEWVTMKQIFEEWSRLEAAKEQEELFDPVNELFDP